MQSTTALLKIVKSTGQDFEWYPTTDEIIAALKTDYFAMPKELRGRDRNRWDRPESTTVMDIGAGNGKVLSALVAAGVAEKCYAIEKSIPLISCLPPEFVIVGTDFWEQSLYDKSAHITFSNPPYSEFEAWAERIIQESGSLVVYLVLPVRWQDSHRIQSALKYRGTEAHVIGEFSFENAEDRKARAIVNLIRVNFSNVSDAFDRFFEATFSELLENFKENADLKTEQTDSYRENHTEIVDGKDLVTALVELYRIDVAKVQASYNHLCGVDVSLLIELDVTISSIKAQLINRLSELKKQYWKRVFDNLDKLTERLTSKNRRTLMDKIFAHSAVDFTVQNAYAIILWAIQNANEFIDSQVLAVYETMIEAANVINYKSNDRVFVCNRWRYAEEAHKNSHFYLNYRIVLERVGGIYTDSYSTRYIGSWGGLQERAHDFISDLLTVANNLNFPPVDHVREFEWKSNLKNTFRYRDDGGELKTLFTVRAFKNGNLHMMLNNDFALALNIEHGRLKGWVRNPQEVVAEMPEMFDKGELGFMAGVKAAQFFGKNFQIGTSNLANLLPSKGV